MNHKHTPSPLFLIVGSLLLLLIFVGLLGCTAAVDEAVQPAAPVAASSTPVPGPVETTAAFYDWYFDYIGEPGSDNFHNPLVDRAYRDSQYLSDRFIREVDELLAGFAGGGYDPFLMAQDFPQDTTVEAWAESDDTARVVVHQQWGERTRDLAVDLIRADGRWLIDDILPGSPTTPEGTTELFYNWYLGYFGDRSSGEFNNPLVDGAYRESEYLSDSFVQKVDEILASAAGGGYDPILLAQDIPRAYYVGRPQVEGDSATVTLELYWEGNPTASPRTVTLVQEDGRWLIADVTMDGQAPALLPAEVVDTFYAQWRSAVVGAMESGAGSPLAEGVYRDSRFLTEDFKNRVDAMVAGLAQGGYDPFLCAQDVPAEITPESTFMGSPQAHVLVTTSYADHAFTVVLRLHGAAAWQIEDVICGNSPLGATAAFYTWYLGYPGDPAASTMRNPLVDDAYKHAPYLSEVLIAETDALLAEMRQGPAGYDPFLQAQDRPTAFKVHQTEQDDQVLVELFFGHPDNNSTRTLRVTLVEEGGRWLLRSVESADAPPAASLNRDALDQALAALDADPVVPTGEVVVDETYGFSFQIPEGWVAQPLQMDVPGMPDDWPVEAGYQIMPASLAEEMAQRSGPPSPDDPPLFPPFTMEVVIGDQAAFDRAFVPAFFSADTTINGYPLTVQQEGNGDALLRYVFHNGQNRSRWIVFKDNVGGFSGRATQAAEVAGVLPGIFSTFTFQ